jgi:hypothetical protein
MGTAISIENPLQLIHVLSFDEQNVQLKYTAQLLSWLPTLQAKYQDVSLFHECSYSTFP